VAIPTSPRHGLAPILKSVNGNTAPNVFREQDRRGSAAGRNRARTAPAPKSLIPVKPPAAKDG
jgi:hypothetical protein